ncbi:MAG: hypothetical protein Kow0059_18580 [Candidatus Sumerlaeia bacterium]
MTIRFAWFVSPHGFGHAARACAIMQAIAARRPDARFEIFTRVPEWFFAESLPPECAWAYHDELTDIGLAQKSPLEEDFEESVRRLDAFYPLRPKRVAALARLMRRLGVNAVVCDISPLGLAVACEAGLPGVLVENFTWDWIYEGYLDIEPRLGRFADCVRKLFERAGHHIQTQPVCRVWGRPALETPPVSRPPRRDRGRTRSALGVSDGERLVLVSMGGVEETFDHLTRAAPVPDGVRVVVVGGAGCLERHGRFIRLPHHSGFYHPDLVHAADAVVGKLGYSTLAEAFAARTRFLYIPRSRFRESLALERFAAGRMSALRLTEDEFRSGAWPARLTELLALPQQGAGSRNGADVAAEYLCRIIETTA